MMRRMVFAALCGAVLACVPAAKGQTLDVILSHRYTPNPAGVNNAQGQQCLTTVAGHVNLVQTSDVSPQLQQCMSLEGINIINGWNWQYQYIYAVFAVQIQGCYSYTFPDFSLDGVGGQNGFSAASGGMEFGVEALSDGSIAGRLNPIQRDKLHWFQLVKTNCSAWANACSQNTYVDGAGNYWFLDNADTQGNIWVDVVYPGNANHMALIDAPTFAWNLVNGQQFRVDLFTFIGYYADDSWQPTATPTQNLILSRAGVQWGFLIGPYTP